MGTEIVNLFMVSTHGTDKDQLLNGSGFPINTERIPYECPVWIF